MYSSTSFSSVGRLFIGLNESGSSGFLPGLLIGKIFDILKISGNVAVINIALIKCVIIGASMFLVF